MPDHPDLSITKHIFDTQVLELLACPVCHGSLRMDVPENRIICAGCARTYPLVDGIPVLIPERVGFKP